MAHTVIERVTVVPGRGRPVLPSATVSLDAAGRVTAIDPDPGAPPYDPAPDDMPTGSLLLVPAAVDLHLDNLVQRRRPRAGVTLDHAAVITALDAECAASGIATVCVAARCEHSPRKGIDIADAARLAAVVEDLGPSLSCDWRIHARVELTDDGAVDALHAVLAASSRVALISLIETSVQRSRFGSLAETRAFYAEDWGVSEAEVEEVFAVDPARLARVDGRRADVAALAVARGIPFAGHDDRTPEHVVQSHELGARIAEFPLTMAAARHARQRGMHVVLGAPNAYRGRSTSPGNVLAAAAVSAGVCDILCSDYLPAALQTAPHILARNGVAPLARTVDLVSVNPAAALGLPSPAIDVGAPLTAALQQVSTGGAPVGLALWRDGRLVFSRTGSGARAEPAR